MAYNSAPDIQQLMANGINKNIFCCYRIHFWNVVRSAEKSSSSAKNNEFNGPLDLVTQ